MLKETIIKHKYQIINLILIYIITVLFNLICNDMTCDEMWNYGFSYNISNGLIPYKDFNMVITPLFPYLGAIFLLLFGKNFIIYHIFNGIICTSIFYYMKKNNPKSYYLPYAILLSFSLPNYSLFCLLLLYIIMGLEKKNKNDYLIGLFLGLTFLTKQNVGILLCIPTLFTKDIKKIIKRIIGFLIPNLIFLIYLLLNNNLTDFINYCFLGISSFAKENTVIYPSCLVFTIGILIYLIIKYLKTKDINLLYLIFFQGLAIPMFDPYHTMIPFVPGFCYLLSNLKLSKKVITFGFLIFLIIIFALQAIKINNHIVAFPNQTNTFKYRILNTDDVNSVIYLSNYLKESTDRVFIVNMYAYLIKLEANLPIDKFDLLNDGNLGKDGDKQIIKEIEKICMNQKCTFLLYEQELTSSKELSQYNKDILKYIATNYQNSGIIMGLTIYKNY